MNFTKLEMCISLGWNNASYLLQCMKICSLVSTSTSPHGHWNDALGKNLCLYSPMGACPNIMQVNLTHMEFDIPMCGSHKPPLAYVGLITLSLSSSKSRNNCPFFLLSLKDFCHDLRVSVVMSLVETTNLSHSTLWENEENSMESLGGLCYLLIHFSYLPMCTLK